MTTQPKTPHDFAYFSARLQASREQCLKLAVETFMNLGSGTHAEVDKYLHNLTLQFLSFRGRRDFLLSKWNPDGSVAPEVPRAPKREFHFPLFFEDQRSYEYDIGKLQALRADAINAVTKLVIEGRSAIYSPQIDALIISALVPLDIYRNRLSIHRFHWRSDGKWRGPVRRPKQTVAVEQSDSSNPKESVDAKEAD